MSDIRIFKRKIYDRMLQWKQERDGKTALLVKGARRVGKSTIVEEFARQEYDSYMLIDFARALPLVNLSMLLPLKLATSPVDVFLYFPFFFCNFADDSFLNVSVLPPFLQTNRPFSSRGWSLSSKPLSSACPGHCLFFYCRLPPALRPP